LFLMLKGVNLHFRTKYARWFLVYNFYQVKEFPSLFPRVFFFSISRHYILSSAFSVSTQLRRVNVFYYTDRFYGGSSLLSRDKSVLL
jgi:hypothetical protein